MLNQAQGPHSVEAEQSVLGALLLDCRVWDQVADMLRPQDFYRPDHRIIFGAMVALAGQGRPSDVITLSEYLGRTGELEAAGGFAYLSSLARDTPSAANVRAYADIVLERARLRALDALGAQVSRSIADGAGTADVLAHLRSSLDHVERSLPRGVEPLATVPVSAWAGRSPPAQRDWIIEGLLPARSVTSLLGDGGLGKTIVSVQIGVNVAVNHALYGLAVNGDPVLGVFCEDEEDVLDRRVRAACAAEVWNSTKSIVSSLSAATGATTCFAPSSTTESSSRRSINSSMSPSLPCGRAS